MRMKAAVMLLLVSVSLTEAAGCAFTSSPHCYKNSTEPHEDFICEWDKRNPEKTQTHILHVWDTEKKQFLMRENCGEAAKIRVLLEKLGIPYRQTQIWVQTQVGNLTCNSSNISVILQCMVKYSEPQIMSMKRSVGILNLTLDKPKDNKGALYEIRWRERGSKWQNTTFETTDGTIKDFHMLHLQKQTIYQIQLRRQAKLTSHLCKDSRQHALWSDWSQIVDVPSDIRHQPVIRWVEKQHKNGTRDIHLSWDAPTAEESVGGVMYNLSLSVSPCSKTKKNKNITNQTYNTSITYSEAVISIIAINKVGHSPRKKIVIPAVKHLKYCPHDTPSNIIMADKKTCLEWYKLKDGETRPETVQSSNKTMPKDIKNEVEHFVRHYYFLHILRKKQKYQTAVMCPFYSKQKAPSKGPADANIFNLTHESAVLTWLSIPVAEQHGFLLHYDIWISGQGNTKISKVTANTTSFLIKDLHPGTSYTASISGRTEAGNGPNSTVNFETNESNERGLSWQDQTILIVCVIALLCTIICSIAARRLKLLPEVPSPVIDAAEFRCQEQDQSQKIEEVHELIVVLHQDLSKRKENVTPEQTTLLQDFGLIVFEEEDEEDGECGVTDLTLMKSRFYPNPSYRGQTLKLPEPFHMIDSTSRDNDTESTYKNGLFFETRVLECDKTSL